MGEFNVSNDQCNDNERSELSSDSSSSEEKYKKTSKRAQKVRTTPGSTITLQPDAFRGAMNPDEIVPSSNGISRNARETVIQKTRAMVSIFLLRLLQLTDMIYW